MTWIRPCTDSQTTAMPTSGLLQLREGYFTSRTKMYYYLKNIITLLIRDTINAVIWICWLTGPLSLAAGRNSIDFAPEISPNCWIWPRYDAGNGARIRNLEFVWLLMILWCLTSPWWPRCHPAGAFFRPQARPQKIGTHPWWNLSFWVRFRDPINAVTIMSFGVI